MDTEDSLRLALEAERHNHKKDNEYLLERAQRAEDALRKIRNLDHDDFDTAFRYEQAVRFHAHWILQGIK